MNIVIFTEGSDTISSENNQKYKDYFSGQFLSIKTFGEDLEQFGDVEYHILSEKYGYVMGDESIKDSSGRPIDLYSNSIVNSVSEVDVVIVALKKKNFDEYVIPVWDEIATNINCQIICLSSARSALENIDFSLIPDHIEVISYNRQGVARISNEVKKSVLDKI
jgi:hypothetical protein